MSGLSFDDFEDDGDEDGDEAQFAEATFQAMKDRPAEGSGDEQKEGRSRSDRTVKSRSTSVVIVEQATAHCHDQTDPWTLPEGIKSKYLVVNDRKGQHLYRSETDPVATIDDEGDRVWTNLPSQETVHDLVDIAAARDWPSLSVTGPDSFRQAVWVEASARGIEVTGYTPSELDVEALKRRLEGQVVTVERNVDVVASVTL